MLIRTYVFLSLVLLRIKDPVEPSRDHDVATNERERRVKVEGREAGREPLHHTLPQEGVVEH